MNEDRETVDALDYRSPMDLMNKIHSGAIKLPVWIRIGHSSFGVTQDNMEAFWLGCLFATDEEWRP